MVVEFGVQEDPAVPGRKAQWLLDALATAKTWPSLKALIYFDVVKDGYPWVTDSSASSMSRLPADGAGSVREPGVHALTGHIPGALTVSFPGAVTVSFTGAVTVGNT